MLHVWGRRGTLKGLWWRKTKERVQGAGGWIILKWILRVYDGTAVSQDMDKARAVLNTVIKHEFRKISLLAEKLFAYKE